MSEARRRRDDWPEVGWTSLRLRQFDNAEQAELHLPPTDDQCIVLVDSGVTTIESRHGTSWHGAAYGPGLIGLTAPGQSTDIRWRGTERTFTTHVELPGALIDRICVELWGRDATRLGRPDALAVQDPVLSSVIGALCTAARGGVDEFYAESAATFLAAHLLTVHAAAPPPREPGREDRRVRRAARFIRDNHQLPLTLAEMAAVADLSPFHFLRVFKAHTGETPYRYLTKVRVDRARRHLARPGLSVTEIAHLCGFASPSRLAAAFRSETGQSPSAYRAAAPQ
ncbi:helix-turn-helix domain-containing protein [Kutzneria sp. CA-103260]|uniref:helix-turn-helix domain-containing protein n=1 Tax=Kutzneria sp. CA-103260 TaxID=2802641 RepID=UPI001BA58353|nr:AraC family transcriptional regulator [Kutzneria sp. CA-103260]QUQ66297.1 AraC family transcriptional regulator [Kutzneria sp. CA-103260]